MPTVEKEYKSSFSSINAKIPPSSPLKNKLELVSIDFALLNKSPTHNSPLQKLESTIAIRLIDSSTISISTEIVELHISPIYL